MAVSMPERSRTKLGRWRRKRGDALMGNLPENVPGDFNPRMKLETARDLDEVDSLDKLIEAEREKNK
jgi:hypothetical protein